jgi:Domain of unknown function (DUF4365)
MHLNLRKEKFSHAYVSALCSAAGCSIGLWDVDEDSVDMTIKKIHASGAIPSPQLDIQLKATARAAIGTTGVAFPLKTKNFNDLRQKAHYPRILVVVTLPSDDVADWLEQLDESRLSLMSCGYWAQPSDLPESESVTSTTVRLQHPLTAEVLDDLMDRISHEQPLTDR